MEIYLPVSGSYLGHLNKDCWGTTERDFVMDRLSAEVQAMVNV